MKNLLLITLCAWFATVMIALSEDAMPKQTAQSFKKQVRTNVQANYLLYLPPDYNPTARKGGNWPEHWCELVS